MPILWHDCRVFRMKLGAPQRNGSRFDSK